MKMLPTRVQALQEERDLVNAVARVAADLR
jgi:hypothetical protein